MDTVKVVIKRDDQFESPREWDHLGTMICFHRRYNLGDNHKLSVHDAMKLSNSKDLIELPLYLYDHSGITIATTPFSCPWDSGKVGFIYVTKQKAREWFGVKTITKKVKERIIAALESEVKEYDDYLRGNVYYYEEFDSNGDSINAVGGYIGESGLNEIKSYFYDVEVVMEC